MTDLICKQSESWTIEEFHHELKLIGEKRYHNHHPFHKRMHAGELSESELRTWITNRFYYQINLPVKDSIIMSKLPKREDRLIWIQRIIDHDGKSSDLGDEVGGIDAWIKLAQAAGISEEQLNSSKAINPSAKFAVDAYVNFCREKTWFEAVASSLTELFAPNLISDRIEVFEKYYSWIDSSGMDYFKRRLLQAPRDCDHALALVLNYGNSRVLQDRAISALNFKCDVLWALVDAIELASKKE